MKSVILVGAGSWGQNWARQLQSLKALGGIVETDPQRREWLQAQYPEIPLYARVEVALAQEASALVIATPAPSHYELAKAALEAGKDCLLEKPMTLKGKEARELAQRGEAQGLILMVGHLLLYQPAIVWMSDYIRRGNLGKIYHVATARNKLGKVRATENVWWSFAPHDVSVVLQLLGNPALESVKGQLDCFLQPQIADNAQVALTFKGGQSAHIHCCWYWPQLERRTIVLGEKGMLVYDEAAKTVTVHQKTISPDLQNQDQGSWQPELDSAEPLAIECRHFLDCLETRQKPLSDGWNGVQVVETLEKVMESV